MRQETNDTQEANVKVPASPHQAARSMKVVMDERGDPWLCDAGTNPKGDLAIQGCWRCGDMAFTRND